LDTSLLHAAVSQSTQILDVLLIDALAGNSKNSGETMKICIAQTGTDDIVLCREVSPSMGGNN
jgi:hypothetical protein